MKVQRKAFLMTVTILTKAIMKMINMSKFKMIELNLNNYYLQTKKIKSI